MQGRILRDGQGNSCIVSLNRYSLLCIETGLSSGTCVGLTDCSAELARYENIDDELFLQYYQVDPVDVMQRAFEKCLRESKDEVSFPVLSPPLFPLAHLQLSCRVSSDPRPLYSPSSETMNSTSQTSGIVIAVSSGTTITSSDRRNNNIHSISHSKREPTRKIPLQRTPRGS